MDLGVLLSVPLESMVIRAVVATLGTVVLVRLLLRMGLRSSPARVATALAPAVALLGVVVLTGASMRPPTLMLPADGARALPIPVRDGYLHFAPMAAPLLVGLWASIATWRLGRRGLALARVRRQAGQWLEDSAPSVRVDRVAANIAAALDVATPRVAIRPTCPGGAYVVGARRPVVVIGADLVESLDDEELEGVLAHELAHVRRRDTLVATALGVMRDLTFFVPGGGWAVQQLHRERELAADQAAVRVTGRPGALASGLLKVLETGPSRVACAALVPSGGVVDRVKVLVDGPPTPTTARRRSEAAAVVVVIVTATAAAIFVPATITGPEREREALALVWSATQPAASVAEVPDGEARVFDVYRRSNLEIGSPDVGGSTRLDEHSQENRRGALRACEAGDCPAPGGSVGLGLQPQSITVDDAPRDNWQPRQVGNLDSSDGFRIFWLQRGE